MKAAPVLVLLLVMAVACDKPDPAAEKPVPSAATSAPAPPPPVPTATAAASAPAAPSPSAASPASTAPTKDVVVSVFDPTGEHQRTARVLAGGSVAVYLPEWAGTTWKIAQADSVLGKPKEETIPGFAGPTTPAHAFTWQIKPALKGQTKKVSLVNGAKGQPQGATFAVTIEVS